MLDEIQVAKVRLVLTSSGWNDVMEPAILARGNEALKMLCKSPAERVGKETDEELRATIKECSWQASNWGTQIAVFESNRLLDELQSNAANP